MHNIVYILHDFLYIILHTICVDFILQNYMCIILPNCICIIQHKFLQSLLCIKILCRKLDKISAGNPSKFLLWYLLSTLFT